MNAFRFAQHAVAIVVVLHAMGCPRGSDSTSTSSSSGTPGTERNDCRPDGSCDTGLVCLSGLCVAVPVEDGGSSSSSSGDAGGSSSSSGGVPDGGVPMFARVPACDVVSINNVAGDNPVPPLSDVLFTAAAPATPPGMVTSRAWRVERVPAGGSVQFRDRGSVEARAILEAAGYYEFSLTQSDADGGIATTTCSVDVVPLAALHVELFWDVPRADADLHLVRGVNGVFTAGSNDDCHYANCKPGTMGMQVNWDPGSMPMQGGNPVLEVDDVEGYGPEIIRVNAPLAGDYQVVAEYFADDGMGPTTVDVRIWVQGRLASSFRRELPIPAGQPMRPQLAAAVIHWPDSALDPVCITALGGSEPDHCVTRSTCTAGVDCPACTAATPCGHGNACNVGLGQCLPAAQYCAVDGDCDDARACASTTGACIRPECGGTPGAACTSPTTCDEPQLRCIFQPAVCAETNEPNNSLAEATPLATPNASDAGPPLPSWTLCRGDVDYISFTTQANKRAHARVSLGANIPGLGVALVDGTGTVLNNVVMQPASGTSVNVYGSFATETVAYVRLTFPLDAGALDSTQYSVTVSFLDPLACETEPGEPNNSPQTASNSVVTTGSTSRVLCGSLDQDFHRFTASGGRRVTVRMDFDGANDMQLRLLSSDGVWLATDVGGPPPHVVTTATATGSPVDLVIHVSAGPFLSTDNAVPYTLQVTETDIPTCNEAAEPNNSGSEATPMPTPGTYTGTVCTPTDEDWYSVVLPQPSTLSGTLSWTGTADLDLYLLRDSVVLDQAALAGNPEVVDGTLAAGTYLLRVRGFSSTESLYPVPYSLSVVIPNFCSEDVRSNGTGHDSSTAAEIRADASAPLAFAEDLRMCVAAPDWFRFIALADERIRAEVSGMPGARASLFMGGTGGLVPVAESRSTSATSASLSAPVNVPGAIFYMKLEGTVAVTGADYHAEIITETDTCTSTPDLREPDDTTSHASRVGPGMVTGVMCPVDDHDVFLVSALAGAPVVATVAFDGTAGDVDVALHAADGTQLGADEAVNSAAGASASVSVTVANAGDYAITVTRKPGGLDGQAYTLDVSGVQAPGTGSSSGGGGSSSQGASSSGGASASSSGGSSSGAASSASAGGSSG